MAWAITPAFPVILGNAGGLSADSPRPGPETLPGPNQGRAAGFGGGTVEVMDGDSDGDRGKGPTGEALPIRDLPPLH